MKIILVPNPTVTEDGNTPDCHIPLGILSLATVLRNGGYNVKIIDINACSEDVYYSNIPDLLCAEYPDVIGFSTMCSCFLTTMRIARGCRQILPGAKIILGGPHATHLDEYIMSFYPAVDMIMRGEAETNIISLIECLEQDDEMTGVPGLTLRRGKDIVKTPNPPLIANLAELPDIDYDLFPSLEKFKQFPVEDGRGCPYKCAFCCTCHYWNRKYRVKPVAQVVSQIADLVDKHGARRVAFTHDIFSCSRQRAMDFCQAMIESNLDIPWSCSTRPDSLDETLLNRMVEAGCDGIYFGIESGSVQTQQFIHKRLNPERVRETVHMVAKKKSVRLTSSFIIGFPQERIEDVCATLRLIMHVRYQDPSYNGIQTHILYPLVNSELFDHYKNDMAYDGYFSGYATSYLYTGDIEEIMRHPPLFSPYYFYRPKYMERVLFLKIHFMMIQLAALTYTAFVLWQDSRLDYPQCLFDYHDHLELPVRYSRLFGTADGAEIALRFLQHIVRDKGLTNHYIHDIMRYEQALLRLKENDDRCDRCVIPFDYDVEDLLYQIEKSDFSNLPKRTLPSPNLMVMAWEKEKPVTIKLPACLEKCVQPDSSLSGRLQAPTL